MTTLTLIDSYRACRRVVRTSGSNFPWTFYVLPRDKHRGMDALYAFARRTDDIGDSHEELEAKRIRLARWREALAAALHDGCLDGDALLPALADAVRQFSIPPNYLFQIIDGVERDLSPGGFQTFSDVTRYCDLVASAVGVACVYIWGYTSEEVFPHAVACGQAFQWTNILRDLREDAERGRVYLPLEDLAAFGLTVEDLRGRGEPARLLPLLERQFARAEAAYLVGKDTARFLSPEGRRVFSLMFGTYLGLFQKLKSCGPRIVEERVRLGFGRKLAVVARCFLHAGHTLL